jgi:hypothetical protein
VDNDSAFSFFILLESDRAAQGRSLFEKRKNQYFHFHAGRHAGSQSIFVWAFRGQACLVFSEFPFQLVADLANF